TGVTSGPDGGVTVGPSCDGSGAVLDITGATALAEPRGDESTLGSSTQPPTKATTMAGIAILRTFSGTSAQILGHRVLLNAVTVSCGSPRPGKVASPPAVSGF